MEMVFPASSHPSWCDRHTKSRKNKAVKKNQLWNGKILPKTLAPCVLLVLSYSCRPFVVLRKSRRKKKMRWLGEFRNSMDKEQTEHRCELCHKPTELVWTGEILLNMCFDSV